MPVSPDLPSSAAVARALLPGVRMALRERYNRLQMAFLSPFLLIVLQIMGEFLLKFLLDYLKDKDAPTATLTLLAMDWSEDAMPEVRHAMARVAAGDTGE